MSMETQLEKALNKLRASGMVIGEETTYGGEVVIPVDGVLKTHAQVFQAAEISPEA